MERRFAAILAADIVGFSRLTGEDGIGVLNALKPFGQRCSTRWLRHTTAESSN
jgi:class 3 adenylate cyclase